MALGATESPRVAKLTRPRSRSDVTQMGRGGALACERILTMARQLPLALWLVVCVVAGALGGEAKLTFKVTPANAAFIRGQPVQFFMRFENPGRERVVVDLGAAGREHVGVTVEGEGGKETVRQGRVPGGLSFNETLEIQPASARTTAMVLDDFVVLSNSGTYQVTVRVGKKKTWKASTTIHILPTVEETCARLWKQCGEAKGSFMTRQQVGAQKLLCLTRHRAAVKYQMKIVSRGLLMVPLEQLKAAVRSMLQIHNKTALEFLVKDILANHPPLSGLRRIVLWELRSVSSELNDASSAELLKPYEAEIAAARPVGHFD